MTATFSMAEIRMDTPGLHGPLWANSIVPGLTGQSLEQFGICQALLPAKSSIPKSTSRECHRILARLPSGPRNSRWSGGVLFSRLSSDCLSFEWLNISSRELQV